MMEIFQKINWKIVLIEQTNQSIELNEFNPKKNQKYCFVFGNEVFGISKNILPYGDFSIEIPQFGTKHSLNIAVSFGIVIWDFFVKSISK